MLFQRVNEKKFLRDNLLHPNYGIEKFSGDSRSLRIKMSKFIFYTSRYFCNEKFLPKNSEGVSFYNDKLFQDVS